MARGPHLALKAISSGLQSHFVNDEKIMLKKTAKCVYEKSVGLVEYNIST